MDITKIQPKTLEYRLDYLLSMAEKGSMWARRELELNGWCDGLSADAGEEPKRV